MSRILVVDDDIDIQLLLRLELSAEGHEVSVAGNGQEALDVIGDYPFDLILLDVMMPVLDGWEVLEALDHPDLPPIVMVSAFAADDAAVFRRALEMGAHEFLPKPFDPDRLHRIIESAISMTRDEREADRDSRLRELRG